MSATSMSPFQIPPAYKAYPRNNPGKTFFPNWWILDWSFAVIGWYSTNEPNGIIGPLKVCQDVFHRASSHQTRDLECFADKHSSPWNLPTTFHLDPIATIQQRCLPLLCALLFQLTHLFPICVVSTYNDSMKDLHKLCQIPRNCQCKWTLGKLLSVSWEVFVLHGDDWIHWVAKSCTTVAYRWLFRDSQPSLRTLWSAVIKSPEFSARGMAPPMRLLHGVLMMLVLWQISQFRSFGKWV